MPSQLTISLKHTRAESWTGIKNAEAAMREYAVAVERPDEGISTVDVACPECGEILPVKVASAAALEAAAANTRKSGKLMLLLSVVDLAAGAVLLWFGLIPFAVVACVAGVAAIMTGLVLRRTRPKSAGVELQAFPWSGDGDSPFGVFPPHHVLPRPAAF